jgi:hypothetical protein
MVTAQNSHVCRFRRNFTDAGGTWWRSWLRHHAASWVVAGSIKYAVIGIFHCPNTFLLHYGSEADSASKTNEYYGYRLGGKCVRCLGLTTLSPSCADCPEILEASSFWNPKGISRPVMG